MPYLSLAARLSPDDDVAPVIELVGLVAEPCWTDQRPYHLLGATDEEVELLRHYRKVIPAQYIGSPDVVYEWWHRDDPEFVGIP